MFFARIWVALFICYINQGILIIKFCCQIPRNDLQKHKIGIGPPIAHFYISCKRQNSFVIWSPSLFFSSSLQRDVIFLPAASSLIDITIRVSPDHPSNFSKDNDKDKDKDKDMPAPSLVSPCRPITSSPSGFTTHSCEMFYAPTTPF